MSEVDATDTSTRPSPPEVDRVAASRAAVAARRARAELKAQIASGARSAESVLDEGTRDPDGPAGTLRVTDFLLAIPAIGVTKMTATLDRLQISNVKRVGGLGRHQRERLRVFLRERARLSAKGRGARLTVLAGPTAVGKGSVSAYIRDNFPEIMFSISATTRKPRPGEVDGVHYYFVSDAEFDRMRANDELLEWAVVHNQSRYGTPRGPVEEALAAGRSVLLEIDLQGARQVRAADPEAFLIFLAPPSWEELVRRLIGRGTESAEEQQRRLETAKVELAAEGEFDKTVVNATVPEAAREVVELMSVPLRAQAQH
ncbi:guanylate kinase [Gryllotalpicola reticulitermitis]|uniref:Guanylate kinase n=1 Tax=Gryllotalpicola reticulitermitis TaxID=1184153 RepID=A0ABV8QAQ1_9MICO